MMRGMRKTWTLPLPDGFAMGVTVNSHGWPQLAPFDWDEGTQTLSTVVALDDTRAARLTMTPALADTPALCVTAEAAPLTATDRAALTAVARRILALDHDLAPLYAMLHGDAQRAWVAERGAGRFLRAATLWEDVVKLILTTNCTWTLTEIMTQRLVDSLGIAVAPGGPKAFPTPRAMARKPEAFYRTTIKAGYRSASLVKLAKAVTSGDLDLDALITTPDSSLAAKKAIVSLPGCGPYVADNLLRILGRGDFLGLDSWSRVVYATRVHNGGRGATRPLKDATIERAYKKFGAYAGLVFWLDVTRHWHLGADD